MDEHEARERLEAERDRLARLLVHLENDRDERSVAADGFGEIAGFDQHQADAASEVFEHEKDDTILASVAAELGEITDALGRLDRETYGLCETCRGRIPDERLEAVPATRFCLAHEAVWEGTQMTIQLPGGLYHAGGEFADDIEGRQAPQYLEFLSSDDDLDEDLALSAEELALHVGDGDSSRDDRRMRADEVELAELRESERDSDAFAEHLDQAGS